MAANEVNVQITVEEKQALKALSSIINSTDKLGKEGAKNVKKLDGAFASFAGNLGAMAASKAIGFFVNGIRDAVTASKELEVYETQFKTILGSTKAAQNQLKELQDFAANTPFQLPGLAVSTRQLLSFGVAQKDIIPTLGQLGDLAAGVGASIDELTIPFGRLVSTQKLTLIELDKFADRGINLYQKLADKSGVSIKNIRDEISKGRIPFEKFTESLGELTNKGGTFFNAMEAQSMTLSGVVSTLDDNFFNLQGAIGDALKPSLIEGAKEMTGIVKGLTESFSENGPAIAKTVSALASLFIIEPAKFWSNFFFDQGGASTNLSEINGEIERLDKLTDTITARINANKDSTLYNSFIGKKDQDIKDLSEAMAKLSEFKKARDSLAEKPPETTEGGSGGGGGGVIAAKLAEYDELNAMAAEQSIVEMENALREKESRVMLNEGELQELRDLETAKLEIAKEFALEKASFIMDSDKRRREQDKIRGKFELDSEKLKGKQAIVAQKKLTQDEKANFNTRNQTADNFMRAGLAITKEGSAANRILSTADAIRNTYAAANLALASAPPPLNFAFAASTIALGLANVAKINSFETGGVVGGFNGASLGKDNTTANVRNGEMVLTGSQQKTLFNDISSGENSNNGAMMGMLQQIANAPVVVQIDGREIARANRTAMQEGFGGVA